MATLTLDYFALVSICLMGAMSPGPSLFVILGIASQRGVKAGMVASWSHAFGVALWASVSVFTWYIFIGNAQGSMGYLVHVVSWLASFYLIYMSVTLLKQVFYTKHTQGGEQTKNQGHLNDERKTYKSDAESSTPLKLESTAARAGLSISLANPKLLVFFSAIYPQVLPKQYSTTSLVIAITIPFIVDGVWYQMVTIFAEKVGILRLVNQYQKLTKLITASILMLLASRTIFLSLMMIL
ncbi:MAG: hypothetical protein CMH49_05170 [Myxococcales bacterium]|nr:hypothetical protein [Myxococcales bacterium]